jgi:serine/threonine protein phosphatase PrpC
MVDLFIESGHASINKHDETLCGDSYSIKKNGEQLVVVLSDGLGSGVKANILSTLTANMLSTMMLNHLPVDECIETVATTLPMCRERKLAYSTFTLACFTDSTVRLVQYDNPTAILLRNGKNYDYPTNLHFIGEKKILEGTVELKENDTLVLMTDGITNAGIGKLSPNGWSRSEVADFLERWYTPDISPQNLAARLVEAGNVLCMDSNDDDMTVLVFKIRPRKAVNVLIGPPADPKDDARVLKLFFAKDGYHICCGGSTAQMISRYLSKPIVPIADSGTDKVPAIAKIEGMDLVTEGIITLQQVADLAERYVSDNRLSITINSGSDGVSLLCSYLFEEATDINFFFGKAENTANDDLGIGADAKAIIINRLTNSLKEMGKNVKLSRC